MLQRILQLAEEHKFCSTDCLHFESQPSDWCNILYWLYIIHTIIWEWSDLLCCWSLALLSDYEQYRLSPLLMNITEMQYIIVLLFLPMPLNKVKKSDLRSSRYGHFKRLCLSPAHSWILIIGTKDNKDHLLIGNLPPKCESSCTLNYWQSTSPGITHTLAWLRRFLLPLARDNKSPLLYIYCPLLFLLLLFFF